jgi:hypothetical protein
VIVNAPLSGTAASVRVTGDQTFKFLAGNSAPTNSNIVLTAVPKGALEALTVSYQWKYYKTSAPVGWTNLPVPSTSNTYTLGYDWTNLNNQDSLQVQCEASVVVSSTSYTYTDEITVSKVRDGTAGTNARSVDLTAPTQVISYAADNTTPSVSSIILTATPRNTSGTVFYEFFVNGTSQGSPSSASATYTYTSPTTYSSSPVTIRVEIRETLAANPIVATDVLTIYSVKPGAQGATGSSAITVIFGNEAHTLPTTAAGTVTYTGSGSTVQVYEGNTLLTFTTGTLGAGQFTLSNSVSSGTVTVGTPTGNATTTATIPDYINQTTDLALVTWTINARRTNDSATVTSTKIVSLAKSKQGDAGTNGINTFTIALYSKNTSNVTPPTAFSGTFNYQFSTDSLTGGTLAGLHLVLMACRTS